MRDHAAPDWPQSGAPIAQVLNNEDPVLEASQSVSNTQPSGNTPFSGKLVDLLLTPAEELPNKRRKTDDQHDQSSLNVSEGSVIQLPKLPQLPKKTTKRPRIPPLLQGLHQPPPLPPTSRLFPPITEGVNGYERERIEPGTGNEDSRGKVPGERVHDFTQHSGHGQEVATTNPSIPVPNADVTPPQSSAEGAAPTNAGSSQKGRKRRKWSDEETKDLLVGVSRFGIGSWKKILQCPDFTFHGRTAVDLKDRFRVCCPGDGLKTRGKPRQKNRLANGGEKTQEANKSPRSARSSKVKSTSGSGEDARKLSTQSRHIGPEELAKLGIQEPFAKNTRRSRHAFTEQDDENLMKGFEKYGAVWHMMWSDEDLNFRTRRPTDLRDRFRTRFPDLYAKAGYKLKPKAAAEVGDARKSGEEQQAHTAPQIVVDVLTTPNSAEKERLSQAAVTDTNTPTRPAPTSVSKPLPLVPHFLDTFPADNDDNSIDGDSTGSPIILNRNILQWADANSTSIATTLASMHPGTQFINDMTINPLATLNIPWTTLPNYTPYTTNTNSNANNNSSILAPLWPDQVTSSIPTSTSPAPNSRYTSSTADPQPSISSTTHLAAPSHTSHQPRSNPSSSSTNALLRTPNLPTIVFPHVPAASARSTMHNLPTPADLLSGIDDGMGEGQGGVGAGGDGVFGYAVWAGDGIGGWLPHL